MPGKGNHGNETRQESAVRVEFSAPQAQRRIAQRFSPGELARRGAALGKATVAIALWVQEMRRSGKPVPASSVKYEALEVAS